MSTRLWNQTIPWHVPGIDDGAGDVGHGSYHAPLGISGRRRIDCGIASEMGGGVIVIRGMHISDLIEHDVAN